jgi:hypothetical protein
MENLSPPGKIMALLWIEVVLVVEGVALGNPFDTVLEWFATEP